MKKKLNYNSNYDDIGWSLRETLDEIDKKGETKELKYDMLLKYGRMKFMEGKFNKAYKIFMQCSSHSIDNCILDNKEIYYWASRCLENMGNEGRALNGYLRLLENEKFINDENFVDAVLDRLIFFGDITSLVTEYKRQRNDQMTNPKDSIGKVLKFLRENT